MLTLAMLDAFLLCLSLSFPVNSQLVADFKDLGLLPRVFLQNAQRFTVRVPGRLKDSSSHSIHTYLDDFSNIAF